MLGGWEDEELLHQQKELLVLQGGQDEVELREQLEENPLEKKELLEAVTLGGWEEEARKLQRVLLQHQLLLELLAVEVDVGASKLPKKRKNPPPGG